MKKKLGRRGKGGSKLSPKLEFCHFLKVASLVFVDIAKDCSLVQYLISTTIHKIFETISSFHVK